MNATVTEINPAIVEVVQSHAKESAVKCAELFGPMSHGQWDQDQENSFEVKQIWGAGRYLENILPLIMRFPELANNADWPRDDFGRDLIYMVWADAFRS